MNLPRPLPRSKSRRLPERKAVTIIAGFRTSDGIVICGDTQETIANLSKRNVAKVKLEPWYVDSASEVLAATIGGPLAACFCGAGNGPFIDMLTKKAWKAAKHCTDLQDGCACVEELIKETYREYGGIYQPGECPFVELIYGLKVENESRMFFASGPVVNEVEEYCSGGVGSYMADFLAARMRSSSISVHQAVILAAYILLQAKEHVDGCGGESHIAVLRHHGRSGLVDQSRIEAITKLLSQADQEYGQLILATADLRETAIGVYKDTVDLAVKMVGYYQDDATKKIKDHDDLWRDGLFGDGRPKDDLGFAKLSDPRKSEVLR